jgi:hypothetical protein
MINHLSPASLNHILGIPETTPLSLDAMCSRLQVSTCLSPDMSPRLIRFTSSLQNVLQQLGVAFSAEADATAADKRFRPGTVILAPGSFPESLLPINRVSTLYNNIIVGIYDTPPPLSIETPPQQRLDAIVSELAWHMVHLLIYVTDNSWTVCTMNGGIAAFDTPFPEKNDVRQTLIPKITAQVVPPRPENFNFFPGMLDTGAPEFYGIAEDFSACSGIWNSNEYLLTHTSRETLAYRNGFYKKIVARYLDQRSGMSYGFFARQLPLATAPAIPAAKIWASETSPEEGAIMINGQSLVPVCIQSEKFLVPLPSLRVITTRSGCRKTAINPRQDLVEIGLHEGKAYLKTPDGLPEDLAAKPSFDTLTILAHAAGNAMIASLLQALRPGSPFPRRLRSFGAAMTHWHHYPENETLPEGYFVHGRENPPVSCSTPQSAAYSLLGKIDALEQALNKGMDYLGDIHIEPNHGTNMVGGLSLAETARIMNRVQETVNS